MHVWNKFIKGPLVRIGWACLVLVGLEGCDSCNKGKSDHDVLPEDPKEVLPGGHGVLSEDYQETPDRGGIPNIGNTCYMNAGLQILAKLYPHTFAGKSRALAQAGQCIVDKIKDDQGYVTEEEAGKFLDVLVATWPKAQTEGRNTQQDAQEFLGHLLDHLRIPGTIQLCSILSSIRARSRHRTINDEPEKHHILSVPLRTVDTGLQDCIDSLFAEEPLADYKDEETEKLLIAEKKLVLKVPIPGLLPIQFKRFTHESAKIEWAIKQPLELIIRQGHQQGGTVDVRFSLVGFILHSGSTIAGGHYTAYICKDAQWTLYNDASVTKVDQQAAEKAAEQAYLYFYQKQKAS